MLEKLGVDGANENALEASKAADRPIAARRSTTLERVILIAFGGVWSMFFGV